MYSHGLSKSRIYGIFLRMNYSFTAGKISICDRWIGRGVGFENFIADMGHPLARHCLLLKSGETVYGPTSCEWKVYEGRPMPLKFIITEIESLHCAGVYKITFDNGTFYIGSTSNFRVRIGVFKSEIRDGYAHNKRMKKSISESDTATFEVICICPDAESVKTKEDFYIKQNCDNPMMLNRSHSAFSNKGCRWTEEEKTKMKKGNCNDRTGRRGKRGPSKKNKMQS